MIGKRLKRIRKGLGLTQREFAKSIGISEATLRRYESGQNFPDAGVLERIANKYGVNTHWLVTGRGTIFLRGLRKNVNQELLEVMTFLSPKHQRELLKMLKKLCNILCEFKQKREDD
jgi:transcriptional regulator with XRE-family HTH domain